MHLSQKPLLRQYPALVTLAYSYAIASVLMGATATALSCYPPMLNLVCPDCAGHAWAVPDGAWLAIAYWVLLCSVLAYLLIAWGNARVPASIVGIYGAVQPIVTVAASELLILTTAPPHYHLSGATWSDLGALAIFAGLLLVVGDAGRVRAGEPMVPDNAGTGSDHRLATGDDEGASFGQHVDMEQRLLGQDAREPEARG